MPKVVIDGKEHELPEGKNFLEALLTLGTDLPYFCWHPALGSVGACRQCAIKQYKNESDTRGKLVMACMTPVQEGAWISVDDPEVQEFRKSVIEWLMLNHPHDCPVCDEGGECHLQDMTLMTGHTYRRNHFKKRTFTNQDLGPFVNHEMNRCIACYRCVRFYRDYADGHDLNVFATHDHVYFGRHESGVLENRFSGNLVEVCPTGVFTDKTLKRHYTRKWDLQTAPSICVHCGVGCNTIPGERYGKLRRIRNRYHHEINGYFLCDRGRYGYEFVNGERRIRNLWYRENRHSAISPASRAQARERLIEMLRGPTALSRTIGIGSPRASLEANFALRALVGSDRFYSGFSDTDSALVAKTLSILQHGSVASGSVQDVESADAILILGEDISNTAPRFSLALRQAARRGSIFVAMAHSSELDSVAKTVHHASPHDLARVGFAIAHALDPEFPAVQGLSNHAKEFVENASKALAQAKRPVSISGSGLRSEALLEAAANVSFALRKKSESVRVVLTATECNSFGAGLLGGKKLSEAFSAVNSDSIDTIIVLENDLFRRADSEAVKKFLGRAKRVILLDHTATAMMTRADMIVPCSSFAENEGTLVNSEGRAQRFFKVFAPADPIESTPVQESWRWIRELLEVAGHPEAARWRSIDLLTHELARTIPAFAGISEAAPSAGFRIAGNRIARQPHRYSGRTAQYSNLTVHEPKPPMDPDAPFAFSMEGAEEQPPAALVPRFWAPGWNSVQSLNKFQIEVGGPLRGGPAGKRLIEPQREKISPFAQIPLPFTARADRWLAIPLHCFFGSDELSLLSPGVAQLAPRPHVALHPSDAERLGATNGAIVELRITGAKELSLPIRLDSGLAPGTIGIPVGLPGFEGRDLLIPAWCELYPHAIAGAA